MAPGGLSYPLSSVLRMGSGVLDRAASGGFVAAAVRPVAEVAAELRSLVYELDPLQVSARDCMELVELFSTMEHLASAQVALCARRVAEAERLWRSKGHRSAAHWLAMVTGMTVGQAVALLRTAEAVQEAPQTTESLLAGELSTQQALPAAEAERVDADAAGELIEKAKGGSASVKDLQEESTRIVAAASGESDAQKAERIRRKRSLRVGTNPDGSGWGRWSSLPAADQARLVALLEQQASQIFTEARAAGVRESHDAYMADALTALAEHAAGSPGAARDDGPAEEGDGGAVEATRWDFTKVIVRVDASALERGELARGEVCEIAGHGPVPVATVREMIAGGAFVAALSTKGTEIDRVVHLGRRPTALQKTVLDWHAGGTCSIEGCNGTARLEIDHVADWADTHVTRIQDLAPLCGHHHDLKTHKGFRLGPRLPNGRRRLIPPEGVDPPGVIDWRPAADAAIHCDRWDAAAQGDLFDTG